MKLSVIGCGYLGAVHAAAMAELGHECIGIDVDADKVEMLNRGVAPFFESELSGLLAKGLATGRLRFSADYTQVATAQAHFLAVGTPQRVFDHGADLRDLDACVQSLIPNLTPDAVVIGKSTVPIGTATRLAAIIQRTHPGVALAWNPEFLREGVAVRDTIAPDRIVYGLPTGPLGAAARQVLDQIYAKPLASGVPLVATGYETAELVKLAANSFLATKISFINAMAEVAEAVGADVTDLADAIGYDERIGRRFLNAGVGFGGGCLPKDIRAFRAGAEELGVGDSLTFLKEVDQINQRQRERLVGRVVEAFGGSVVGRRIAVLGLAFKPESDDTRDSPALDVAVRLKGLGAAVTCTDPQAIETARRRHPQLRFEPTWATAIIDAEAIMLLTEWEEYRNLDPMVVSRLTSARLIVDGRNALQPSNWRNAGWTYLGVGRP